MRKTVDTSAFTASHTSRPKGYGNWIFTNAAGDEVSLNGTYSDTVKRLPAGEWKLQP